MQLELMRCILCKPNSNVHAPLSHSVADIGNLLDDPGIWLLARSMIARLLADWYVCISDAMYAPITQKIPRSVQKRTSTTLCLWLEIASIPFHIARSSPLEHTGACSMEIPTLEGSLLETSVITRHKSGWRLTWPQCSCDRTEGIRARLPILSNSFIRFGRGSQLDASMSSICSLEYLLKGYTR